MQLVNFGAAAAGVLLGQPVAQGAQVGGDLGLTADKTAGLIEKMTQNLGK